MKPTKGMPAEELGEEIKSMKLSAYELAVQLLKNPESIKSTGHKHWAEPIEYAVKRIEARMKDWERNN